MPGDAAQVALAGARVAGASAFGSPITRRPRCRSRDLVDLPLQRRQRAAAEAALQRLHDERRVAELAGRLVQHEHAEVARDRVEPAAVHDPRAGLRGLLVALDARVREQDLARQVEVVRAGRDARVDQLQPGAASTGRPSSPPPARRSPSRPATPRRRCRPPPAASRRRARRASARASRASGRRARSSRRRARARPGTRRRAGRRNRWRRRRRCPCGWTLPTRITLAG